MLNWLMEDKDGYHLQILKLFNTKSITNNRSDNEINNEKIVPVIFNGSSVYDYVRVRIA